ncbi:MAG: hypothetical protein KJZ86_19910 [Caldilineaceae bacterium]|nr:hypothetical protein [Caldilineaceae bacterium]
MTDFTKLYPLPLPADAQRQQHFWRAIGPGLLALPWISALWLGGSAARGDADRWSSVELHLLVKTGADLPLTQKRLFGMLNDLWPGGWTQLGLHALGHTTYFTGITHTEPSSAGSQGGVLFRLLWTSPGDLALHRAWHGPIHLLWSGDDLPEDQAALLHMSMPRLEKAHPSAVQAGLTHFWHLLASLPGIVNRQEHLAGAALLGSVRGVLTDLVVALNGATRPPSLGRVNLYLGPAQREAFEKTLRLSADYTESWIGQAVGLIILYRWYAPQLVEKYTLAYPQPLEETVLSLLSAEIFGWPAHITTA